MTTHPTKNGRARPPPPPTEHYYQLILYGIAFRVRYMEVLEMMEKFGSEKRTQQKRVVNGVFFSC